MNRRILLVEPNYKNKYPPMGLMKLATYYRMVGDDVRFYKGDLKHFAIQLITEELIDCLELLVSDVFWKDYFPALFDYIRFGKQASLENIPMLDDALVYETIKDYRRLYKDKDYFTHPRYDKVGITTLFTFYWKETIDTINFAKQLCKSPDGVMVGGIMSSILPEKVFEETGIYPFVGQLDKPGDIDADNDIIIDRLPLDYSILEEIDYVYPSHDAYFAYMTRGCINKCKFCAVPRLEPRYCDYVGLSEQIKATDERFGPKRDLLLLDNNVLASARYEDIIHEIENCGFASGASYVPPDEYAITIKNLQDSYNNRAYIRKAVKLYKDTLSKLKKPEEKAEMYNLLCKEHCLYDYSATREAILRLDEHIRPLYEKTHKPSRGKMRIVDFNQGIDSRLINKENMALLAKVNIRPLRIAFDHWNLKETYEKSVRTAVGAGIRELSNYMLFNYDDTPDELYYRLQMNVYLCEELNASIYSFPMKYHPIDDPEYFDNRDYIGKHWNRKYIRAIQAILNSTKGTIGVGIDFFEEAFGRNIEEFYRILWMPEVFIIYRRRFDADLRSRLAERYTDFSDEDNDLANEWWYKFRALPEEKQQHIKDYVGPNKIENDVINAWEDKEEKEVLLYYLYRRSNC